MAIEKLIGTLKVHEQELQQDEGIKKEKSLAINCQKIKKTSLSKEQVSRSLFKALKAKNSFDEESKEESDEDEVAFISQKIHKMWKNKGESRWKNSSKSTLNEKKDKDKSSIVCYECKKLGHFKFECPEQDKSQDKKKYYKTKEKKGLMSPCKDLDDTSSNEEEANLCLMADSL